jgi:hypothetical protein
MEPSSSEHDSRSAAEEFLNILWNPKVHFRVHKNPPLIPILSQMDPVHITQSCLFKIHIVAYRPVAKCSLYKQLPFLGNDYRMCFLRGPCQDVISKEQSYFTEFCTGGCEERMWAREAEESPLLEVVARERLKKTQQASKRFSCCYSDLWFVEINDGAVIAYSSKSCV